MDDNSSEYQFGQEAGISYQELLDRDGQDIPAALREQGTIDPGSDPIPVEHYTSAEFFQRTVTKMWLKTWQMACREEQIPNVGDFYLYEVIGKSLIIVRTAPDEIKALYNSCTHRGRKLVTQNGCRKEFKCPYHGFRWKNDGTFLENPLPWDFKHCSDEQLALPEARCGRWGGFVFVNFDDNAPPLEEVLEPLPRHFERWDLSTRYVSAHAQKVIKCNWMVAMEAFMESWHSTETHPQIIKASGDYNSQVDIFTDHVSRIIAPKGIPSPSLKGRDITQDEIVRCVVGTIQRSMSSKDDLADNSIVPPGSTARAYLGQISREALSKETGDDYSSAADAEFGDTISYSLFPNLIFYGGHLPTRVWRFRPNGMDHASCILETLILSVLPEGAERPKPAPLVVLAEDQKWADCDAPGIRGGIIDQDAFNMPYIQEGMEALKGGMLELSRYQESRIRWLHQVLEKYVNS